MTKQGFFRDREHPWIKSNRFQDLKASELLAAATRREGSITPGKERVWVLDLDSTLLCVAPRVRNVFFEFLRAHPKPKKPWLWLLGELKNEDIQYDLEKTFSHAFSRLDANLAASWAEDLWLAFKSFWEKHFFSVRHLHLDTAYSGSVDWVKQLAATGTSIVYLTGRDRPRCGHITLQSLKAAGFPWNSRTYLFMKEDAKQSDLLYKTRAATVLGSRFYVEGFLDNEPENLVMFAEKFPTAKIVLFHTVMSERVPLKNFRTVLGTRPALRLNSFFG